MKQPLGCAEKDNIVCKLKETIYRLKQSFGVWFEKFSTVIIGIDF